MSYFPEDKQTERKKKKEKERSDKKKGIQVSMVDRFGVPMFPSSIKPSYPGVGEYELNVDSIENRLRKLEENKVMKDEI